MSYIKKPIFVISIIIVIFLVGCESELPPEPDNIGGPIGEATGYYDGYGPPTDVFDNNMQIFYLNNNVFNLPPEQDEIDLRVQVDQEGGFIYRYGHYYTDAIGWKQYEFPQKTVSGSNWIKDSAETYMEINTNEILPGENYIVAYSCKKYDGQWKCGCNSEYGSCNQWMLQTYLYRNVELPPEPIPPGSLITTRVYISPNGKLVKESENVNLYVSLSSTKDILDEIDDLSVRIVDPNENTVRIELQKFNDNCNECKGDKCHRQFQCSASFGASYSPIIEGEHIIDFGANIDVPNWMEINTGKFKLVDDLLFKENLIEETIGVFKFKSSYGYYSDKGYHLYANYRGVNSYVTLNVQDYPWVSDKFNQIKNNPEYDEETVNDQIVYARVNTKHTPYYDEVADSIEAVWMSNGKLIKASISGPNFDNFENFVAVYLKKHPSDESVADEDPEPEPDEPTEIGLEAWKVESKPNKFEISENLNEGENKESIADILKDRSDISYYDLPNVLASGVVSNRQGDFPFRQELIFDSAETGYVQLNEDDSDSTAVYLYFKSGEPIAKYKLEFENSLESNTIGDGGFNGNVLRMLGKKYEIVHTRHDGKFLGLVLMNNPIKDIILEGETGLYNYRGTDYEIAFSFASEKGAKFSVNGEATKELWVGHTHRLADGSVIGVSEISTDGDERKVEFFFGSNKFELSNGRELKVNDETVDGATVNIFNKWHVTEPNYDDSWYTIDEITVDMVADDDYYVLPDTTLSQNRDLDEKDLLFTRNWDIAFEGLTNEPTNEISIKPSGNEKYMLNFKDGDGNDVSLPLAEAVESSLVLGEKDKKLVLTETDVIEKDDYFIVTSSEKSYALQYMGADKISADNSVLKFKNLGDSSTIEQSYTISDNYNKISALKIGGGIFDIYNRSSTANNDFDIVIDQNGDGIINNNRITQIITQYGANIELGDLIIDNSYLHVVISTSNKLKYGNLEPTPFEYRIGLPQLEELGLSETESARIQLLSRGNHNYRTPDGETNAMYAYSSYGALAKFTNPQSEPESVSIEYPKNQRIAQVFITGEYEIPSSSPVGGGGGQPEPVEPAPEEGEAIVE